MFHKTRFPKKAIHTCLAAALALILMMANVMPAYASNTSAATRTTSRAWSYDYASSDHAKLAQLMSGLDPAYNLTSYTNTLRSSKNSYTGYLQKALAFFCPQGIVSEMTVDEMIAMSDIIASKDVYQQLVRAIAAAYESSNNINQLTAAQCRRHYDAITIAMYNLWNYDVLATNNNVYVNADYWYSSVGRRALQNLTKTFTPTSNIQAYLSTLNYYNTVETAVVTGTINGAQQALWNSLSGNTRRATSGMSGYVALVMIQGTSEYRNDITIRNRVNDGLTQLNTTYSKPLRETLEYCCPVYLLAQLNPDELTTWATIVSGKVAYTNLTTALSGIAHPENLTSNECQPRYNTVVEAMYGMWDANTVNGILGEIWS